VETTQKKQSLLCPESQELMTNNIERLFRQLGQGKAIQDNYGAKKKNGDYEIGYQTIRAIRDRKYVRKSSIEKALKIFNLDYDRKLWLSDGVIKIVENGEK